MKVLVDDWKRVALKSFSMWFGCYLPLLWLAVPEFLFAVWRIEMNPRVVWLVAFALATLAAMRIVRQWGNRP